MPGRRAAEAGMTLVEMLIVLVIIGVAAGATVLGIGSASRSNGAEQEARGFAARVQLAADEALVTDRPIALEWTPKGYGFSGQGGGGDALAPHELARGVSVEVGNGAPMPMGTPFDLRFSERSGSAWIVAYDGLNVAVTQAGAPR